MRLPCTALTCELVMAFLAYLFVVLAMVASVYAGLDWVNAPLRPPASEHRAQASTTGSRTASERAAQHKPPANSTLAQRTQAAASIGRHRPETVAEKQPVETTAAAPVEQVQVKAPIPQPRPEPVAQEQPSETNSAAPPEHAAASPPPTQSVAQEAEPEPKRAGTEEAARSPSPESHKAQAKRDLPRRTASQAAARTDSRSREARQHAEREREASAPGWAIRGAEAARREAQREAQTRVPGWAIRGAEAARREAEQAHPSPSPFWAVRGAEAARAEAERPREAQARVPFRPFWESGWR